MKKITKEDVAAMSQKAWETYHAEAGYLMMPNVTYEDGYKEGFSAGVSCALEIMIKDIEEQLSKHHD